MRRPLLFACICLFAWIAVIMQLRPSPFAQNGFLDWEGEPIFLIGQVYEKEYRVSFGEEILVLHLQSCIYSKETDVSYHEFKQSSDKASSQNSIQHIICEINLNRLPLRKEGEPYLPKLGEEIFLSGVWKNFTRATNPGEFDPAEYYAIEGICGKVESAKLLAAGKDHWPVREALFTLRQKLLKNLYEVFPQKEASLFAKMLLGDGSGLDKEVRKLYQDNGIVHILSISGLHISLIGMGIYKLLRKGGLPMRIAAAFGAVFIVLYGIMTGFGVSAARAIGMYLIHMLGDVCGKSYDMLTAMGVLAILLLADNPLLIYHSGYLLSFGSVCGVGLLAPLLSCGGNRKRNRPGERRIVSILRKRLASLSAGLAGSLSVTLFTLPIQLFFFYQVPVYSVLINLFVIPFMSLVMAVGAGAMCMPFFKILSPAAVAIFAWFEWLCNVFQKLPGHTLLTGRPQMWKILLYYGVLLFIIRKAGRWKTPLKKGITVFLLSAALILVCTGPADRFWVAFLDVGQGDCVVVHTKKDGTYLFDGGSSSKKEVGEDVIVPFLQYYGIGSLEGIFLSHSDKDHVNGALWMLQKEAVNVKGLYLPDISQIQKEEFKEILDDAGNIPIHYLSKGDVCEGRELCITCLHPPAGMEGESNASSLCFLLSHEDLDILLTGDVEGKGEKMLTEELRQRQVYEVEVLKAAHHGSGYSTGQEFLNRLQVQLAVISCGRNNSYGHPHAELLTRLKQAHILYETTADRGCIFVGEDGYWFWRKQ